MKILSGRLRALPVSAAAGVLFACLLASVPPRPARAQTPPVAATTSPLPTTDSLEMLRKQAADSTELDAETKQKIEAAVTKAIDGLGKLEAASKLAEEMKSKADTVGRRVATLRSQLKDLQDRQPYKIPSLRLAELEQEVTTREAALAELKNQQARTEAEPANRANRRREIREALLTATQDVARIQKQLDTAAPADEPPLLTTARRAALAVEKALIESQLPALNNELALYDVEDTTDILRLDRDVKAEQVQASTEALEALKAELAKKRAADSQAAVSRAQAFAKAAPDALKDAARRNIALATAIHDLTQPLLDTARKLDETRKRREELEKQFLVTEQRVNEIGLTGSIGAMLRRQLDELPNVTRRRREVHDRKAVIEEAQYSYFEYDDARADTVDQTLQQVLSEIPQVFRRQQDLVKPQAEQLAEQRRKLLDDLLRSYDTYLDTLFDLDATEQRLIRETLEYQDFINERVLWIRSNRPLFTSFALDESDTWAAQPGKWLELQAQIARDVQLFPVSYIVMAVLMLLLLWNRRSFRRELEAAGAVAARGSCCEFRPTLRAALLTVFLSITWPGLVLFIAWRLNLAAGNSTFTRAVSEALFAVTWVYLPLELLRRVFRPGCLAEAHFGFSTALILVVRRNLRWAMFLGIVFVYVTALLYASDSEHGLDATERLTFAIGMVLLAILLSRLLRPEAGVFSSYLVAHPDSWAMRLKAVWYWGAVAAPLVVVGMIIAGYYYTAQQLTWRMYTSFLFVVAVLLLRAFLQRLLLVRRRAISIEQARERLAAAMAESESDDGPAASRPEEFVPPEEIEPDVNENTEQTRRLIRTTLIAIGLIGLWLIWVDVLPALRILDNWTVWTISVPAEAAAETSNALPAAGADAGAANGSIAKSTEELEAVTLADIGLAILIGVVTVICARNIPGLMEISLLQRLPLDRSIRYAVTSVTSYVIVLLGIIIAFNAISVGWSQVQWLATALTFGLAFGLQEIFANFVAGLILLFERPIRVGDVVTVDNVTGVVSRIRIRATTITDWDRKEYVIPNREFITGRMLNWTLSDKTNRVVINVGVAYGSDVAKAKQLLLQICREHPLILEEPESSVTFEAFGDSTLNLVLRTFLPNLDHRLSVVDALHTQIDLAFRDAGIEIAFPQRDLHIRSTPEGSSEPQELLTATDGETPRNGGAEDPDPETPFRNNEANDK